MNAQELDAIVARHNLNEHPFYRAWQAGVLPRYKLVAYASEYAPFIEAIELGWRSLGEHDHAASEREHAGLWDDFRAALGPRLDSSCPEARGLVDEARRSFADPAESVGALYAFESQQPSTARSKLDGLRAHYAVGEGATSYFRIHADEYWERDELRRRVAQLPPDAYARARDACERVCKAMWLALDGIMATSEPAMAIG
jgi:pyrroloquinoline-quinone synthase